MQRPFRFGVATTGAPMRASFRDFIQEADSLGFSSIMISDHPGQTMAVVPALAAAAMATTRLHIGGFVFNLDLRNPVLLAQDILTLIALSEGRFECGMGCGYLAAEYEQVGAVFDPPKTRLSRFEEAVQIVKRLLAEETVSFSGNFYTIMDAKGAHSPQHVPLYIGGGGKRVLSFAAREADIIGLVPRNHTRGLDWTSATAEATEKKVEWIREAAGERFSRLELSSMVFVTVLSPDREAVAQQMGGHFNLSAQQVLGASPILIGTVEQIVDELYSRRDRYGISYIVILDRDMKAFAPVVARLAGK